MDGEDLVGKKGIVEGKDFFVWGLWGLNEWLVLMEVKGWFDLEWEMGRVLYGVEGMG